jgi:2-polyprenyl-3-methyl-5-hydroxy-6-metoxy-1,4-benzoquinol methylase
MTWAIFNDLMQRIITLNKYEQKNYLHNKLKAIRITKGAKVLDFGCGTGLFTTVFKKNNLDYYGYDIDKDFILYAQRIYKNCKFMNSEEELNKNAPYELIIANCCFHHISDDMLPNVLDKINKLLNEKGIFLMIDLLLGLDKKNFLNRLYSKLERGRYLREIKDYQMLLGKFFKILNIEVQHSHPFSFKNNYLYNELVIFECRKSYVQENS